ncbi:uncharacterized protein Pyn_40057 [Prunus yedoensis var. nudiflora]|uniref:Translocation and assembly module TamB C-terminal domain-containing protein n=1 Tax=Prunus yedoensis var. nudiflora TaxID=2094558 RepID=A0A314U7T5_PRUYE|nr:uncharacterized protein Pyn_40057 [Prunus yedoensis var. nudiflora]
MSGKLHCPFLGVSLHSSLNGRNNGNFICWERGHVAKRAPRRCVCEKQNYWITQAIRVSQFWGKNVELLRRTFELKNGMKVQCVKEPFSRSKALVSSLSPLWEEGLLLVRCSVFLAVISGVCLLVWYGQSKAKGFIEDKLLPSVCSVLSEYIQREVVFGKVRRLSPLSITLESCSVGPHSEEFSCGEVPSMKLRLRPFASLRRGRIVIDAVLSHPTVLVAQKKDYTWLGIPSSEGGLQRHLSTEEGIDHQTKTRRLSREEAAARWERERDEAAKKAAEMGYIVSDKASSQSKGDDSKEGDSHSADLASSESFPCMDEKMHWRDHCMDTGVDYEIKHADLEKSLGVKIPGSGLKFWSRVIKGPKKHKFKKKGYGSDISASGITAKRRILQSSAVRALAYFQDLSQGKSDEPSQSSGGYDVINLDSYLMNNVVETNAGTSITSTGEETTRDDNQNGKHCGDSAGHPLKENENVNSHSSSLNYIHLNRSSGDGTSSKNSASSANAVGTNTNSCNVKDEDSRVDVVNKHTDDEISERQAGQTLQNSTSILPSVATYDQVPIWPLSLKLGFPSFSRNSGEPLSHLLSGSIQKLTSSMGTRVDDIVAELVDGVSVVQSEGIERMLPVTLDSVHFKGGTLMLLAYGDREPRAMENVDGHVKFQNHYGRVHVQLSGNCQMWRSDNISEDGGWLSADVFVDMVEQKWHANLKIANLFVPLFERILEIPINWSKGRATGEVHLCMSGGETFPNLHGQLDVTGVAFQTIDAPSSFSDISASLCFRGQRIFLHNASGWFGDVPLEASGDFGIHPDEGEFHLMCQVSCVEVNALMRTFKMKPLLFPLAGSVTAVFNCQGPLDAPIFVGSGMVADLYGIRASLVDGGEIRGAGNAWICPEGEVDDTSMDVNFSGNLCFDKILHRYVPGYLQLMPLKLGDLNGETKLSGSLLRPRFDIKWTAPKAEGSFSDARGDIIISHDSITVNSSSAAFDLSSKVQTSYTDEDWLRRRDADAKSAMPFVVEGIDLDLRMRSFEFFNLVSPYPFDSPKPMHLKATGKIKFQGKVLKPYIDNGQDFVDVGTSVGWIMSMSRECIKLDATGRPDESLVMEFVGPLKPNNEDNSQSGQLLSFFLQKGQLKANICFQPFHSASLEIRQLPLDELELASLRGTIQKAEIQLNLQKRRGHGLLSVLRPKFSGVLGEALDVAARWSGDVITVEKTVLEQSNSRYELQGEYVLPGTRDRNPAGKEKGGLLERAMAGHLGSVISSMGRWRMRLEVPRAEVAEMLPLARLVSRSTDPAVHSRSKDLFFQSLQSVGLYTESLTELLEVIRGHYTPLNEVVLEELNLPGLTELRGSWHGSLDASGGGNGDTMAEFDFHGEDWEWGTYKTQRVLAVGAYSNDDGLRLEKMFIQKDNATIHADGTLLGPKTNLHFAVLNFPVSLVPTVIQVVESSATDVVQSLRKFLAPIRGILHMEGDLRGNLAKPECDVQVRLLDGAIGGIDLGRAEIVASLTSTSRFLFNAKFEPIIQIGHVHIQGSVPVTFVQNNMSEEEDAEKDKSRASWDHGWVKERGRGSVDDSGEKKLSRERNEEGWDTRLAESLKGLNWNLLDVGEVRIDADIKDGGMMLLTALSSYAKWLQGNADVILQVRGTVEQPVLDGYASFHRASISSPVLWKPLTNFGGTVHVKSNRTSEASLGDKIDLKCEVLEVRAKNILSAQVDTQMQITGSILQPNISGSSRTGVDRVVATRYVSRFFSSQPAASRTKFPQPSVQPTEKEMEQVNIKPNVDIQLSDLKLALGPELRVVYPLILNFAVSGELELNGPAHPKSIQPRGVLTFENGDVNLVATQVRLKQEHLI